MADEEDLWAPAQALVGQVLLTGAGPDPVVAADFRRKLEVLGLDLPLHTDEACAREAGHPTVPAPVSMTRTWGTPAYWEPGRARPGAEPMALAVAAGQVPGPGDTVLATHLRCEHLQALYPGDTVTGVAVLKSVTPKTTRVGAGAFLVVETTFSNQCGEVVTVETSTVFRFSRGSVG